MKTFSHPFRLDTSGSVATVDEGSTLQAAQLAGHVCSTMPGERPLAPLFGLDEQTGGQVDVNAVYTALATCTPELDVTGVTVTQAADGLVDIALDVSWDDDEEDF